MASVHRPKKNQAHERLLIADYLQRKPSPAPTCPTHTRELEFFCVRCDVLICAYCIGGGAHNGHEARSFNDAHAAVQQEMQLVVAALDARAAEMRAAAAEVKAVGPAVEKAGQASAQQLDDFFDDLRNASTSSCGRSWLRWRPRSRPRSPRSASSWTRPSPR